VVCPDRPRPGPDARSIQIPQGAIHETYLSAFQDRRARTHGFLRMKTRGGRAVINARRAKGRKRLAV
jgi:large subunit ribosomal protein L34